MTDADHLIRAAAWLRAFPHLPTMRDGVPHEHAQTAEALERLAARLPRLVEIAPEDAAAWSRSRGVMIPSQSDYDTATRVEAAIVAHGKVQP